MCGFGLRSHTGAAVAIIGGDRGMAEGASNHLPRMVRIRGA